MLATGDTISRDSIIYEFKINYNNFHRLCALKDPGRCSDGDPGDGKITNVGAH